MPNEILHGGDFVCYNRVPKLRRDSGLLEQCDAHQAGLACAFEVVDRSFRLGDHGRSLLKTETKTMSENFLESPGNKPIGTYKEVFDAIIAEFPGSERETSRTWIVRMEGEHIADVYAYGPNDEEFKDDDNVDNPEIGGAPVTWFNIMGDRDWTVAEFLMAKFGVEEVEM